MKEAEAARKIQSSSNCEPVAVAPSETRCLVVTALTSCALGSHRLLFAGRGSFLEVFDISHERTSSACLGTWNLLDEGSIHGVIARPETSYDHDEVSTIELLVYGSYAIRVAKLTCRGTSTTQTFGLSSLTIVGSYETSDWVLHALLLPAESTSECYALLVSAQNSLYGVSKRNGELLKICRGSRSVLYSACISFTVAGHVLVAAGTVFGEIIIWSCHLPNQTYIITVASQTVLTGHTGSIFGINLLALRATPQREEYLLASCSDDRTVKVWSVDVQRLCNYEHPDGLIALNTEERRFEDSVSMTSAWAHLSRIWKVQFFAQSFDEKSSERHLISCGEDGSCYVWAVDVPTESFSGPFKLRNLLVDRHHSVKNIWSCTTFCNTDDYMVATGGADGRIVLRRVHFGQAGTVTSAPGASSATFASLTHEFQLLSESATTEKRPGLVLKHFRLLSDNGIIALTDSDHITTMIARNGVISPSTVNSWELHASPTVLLAIDPFQSTHIYAATSTELYRIRKRDPGLPRVIAALSEAPFLLIVAHSEEQGSIASACLVVTYRGSRSAEVVWDFETSGLTSSSRSQIHLPSTFSVTTACFIPSSRFLILGSRSGALAVYSEVDRSTPELDCTSCIRHVHSSDSITTILHLSEPSPLSTRILFHILTCGRDGTYAIHRINMVNGTNSRSVEFDSVHVSFPPLGPNIERAYITQEKLSPKREEITLYGFRSTEFVVWNETAQVEFMHVDCGGAHRSWAYRPRESGPGGTFVWTKAGSLNHYHKSRADVEVLAQGGHGREIKTIALIRPDQTKELGISPSLLIATGAEDTNIRLWKMIDENYRDGVEAEGSYRCTGTMKKHTAGLQHLEFSSCQRFLFSSAGREEFFVWHLSTDVPVVDIGVVLWDTMPKDEQDFDNRITNFMAIALNEEEDGAQMAGLQYRFLMAYSNGKVKMVDYSAGELPRTGSFVTIHEFVVGDFCLSTINVLSAKSDYHILVTGTNGYLYGCNIHIDTSSASFPVHTSKVTQHQAAVHQNSVQASQVVLLDNNHFLSITSGDDNAISLAIIPVPQPDHAQNPEQTSLTVIRVPSAHAAAVTALGVVAVSSRQHQILSDESNDKPTITQVIFASTGNDQRIKLWRVRIRLPTSDTRIPGTTRNLALNNSGHEEPTKTDANLPLAPSSLQTISADDVEVRRLRDCERTTDVADVSGMEILAVGPSDHDHVSDAGGLLVRLLVVGAGMESLTIAVPEKYLL